MDSLSFVGKWETKLTDEGEEGNMIEGNFKRGGNRFGGKKLERITANTLVEPLLCTRPYTKYTLSKSSSRPVKQ